MEQDDDNITSVRLTRKFAEIIDGVDLSRNQVGDLLDLSIRDARLLIAEGWAAPQERGRGDGDGAGKPPRPTAEPPRLAAEPPGLKEELER